MKLFQHLLVAPAALGLLAPIASNATEVNLNDISNYYSEGELEINSNSFNNYPTDNNLLAGGEGLMDDGPADSFSTTTSASFSADMAIGAVDGASNETVGTGYGYQIDLSTSFTGSDALSVSLDAGDVAASITELDLNSSGDQLTVDGITYSFPLGEKTTVLVGDSTSGSALYSTACVYGGFTNTLDDCGNGSSAFGGVDDGVALSASYDIGNGFTGAVGYTGEGTGDGLMTKAGTDYYGGQISYAADSYGASVTYANLETSTAWGLNGYYTPESGLPSVSVGYEMTDPETGNDSTQWFVGLQFDEAGPGTFGVAAGSNGAIVDGATEYAAYEAFYSYPVNDGITITPAIYYFEGSTDTTGVFVKTSFSF